MKHYVKFDVIRELRERQGLKQRDLAELAGVSPNIVGLIELGKTNPTIDTLKKIFEALGYTLRLEYTPTSLVRDSKEGNDEASG